MSDRLDTLRSLASQNPADVRIGFMLGMELMNTGDLEAAAEQFRKLSEANPDFAPAYFHGGQTMESLGRIEEARQMYRAGIQVTTRSGDSHTRSELQAALDLLG